MPPRYCCDTSGLSNPREQLPEDIYTSLWDFVRQLIADGTIAVTKEIFDEMRHIGDDLGDFTGRHEEQLLFEVGKENWDWPTYVENMRHLTDRHREHISEYTGGSPKTICLTDMSIIGLAQTLQLPVVSMETRLRDLEQSPKRRIPNICDAEGIPHLTFNEFLRKEGFKK